MTLEEYAKLPEAFLGTIRQVIISRPIGYVDNQNTTYSINCGYTLDPINGDQKIDTYLLGITEPIENYEARIIGYVKKKGDENYKFIVAPDHIKITKEDAIKQIQQVEEIKDDEIEIVELKIFDAIVKNQKFENLSDDLIEYCTEGHLVPGNNCNYLIFKELDNLKLMARTLRGEFSAKTFYQIKEPKVIKGEQEFFEALLPWATLHFWELPPEKALRFRFVCFLDMIDFQIYNI